MSGSATIDISSSSSGILIDKMRLLIVMIIKQVKTQVLQINNTRVKKDKKGSELNILQLSKPLK